MFDGVNKFCELCKDYAFIFCPADDAFLCLKCDAYVHQVNFLAARHFRFAICSQHNHVNNPADLSFSLESDCVSSTVSCSTSQRKDDDDDDDDADGRRSESKIKSFHQACGAEVIPSSSSSEKSLCRPKKISTMDVKAEEILKYWCRILGVTAGGERAVRLGKNALAMCWSQMSVLHLHESLAASLWYGLKFCGDRSLYTQQTLKRLEQISGVQAKRILEADSKLERAVHIVVRSRQRARNDHQPKEGFGESEG